MLKKANRATRREVEEIFKKGKYIDSAVFTFKFIKNNTNQKKISILAPQSVAKTAVKRNFLRRRGYQALEKYLNSFPTGILGVLIFKKSEENIAILENEAKNILIKIN